MIVGNGMLAGSFREYDDYDSIFFCSGVSNSQESSEECFQREADLVKQYSGSSKTFIYFSSSFVGLAQYERECYYCHKKSMELLVRADNENFLIVRLPQVVGFSENKNTLTNYLFDKITSGTPFEIFNDSWRNLLDVDHVAKMTHTYLACGNDVRTTVHLENPVSFLVLDIVQSLESIVGKKAVYSLVEGKKFLFVPKVTKQFLELFERCNINIGETYLQLLLSKYYSKKSG